MRGLTLTLNPIEFDNEIVFYPLAELREIHLNDSIVFYKEIGVKLAKVCLKSYDEGLVDFIKSELKRDIELAKNDVFIVIEPSDVKLKVEVGMYNKPY